MNGLALFFATIGAIITLGGILILMKKFHEWVDSFDDEIDEEVLQSIETLRRVIERETGREVAQIFISGGHWHAVTARGPVLVSDLLKSGYIKVGQHE